MKFKFIIFFLVILALNTSAQEINLLKTVYSPGETLQADINLTVNLTKELASSSIVLLNASQQSMEVGVILTKISDNHYFVYFDLPTQLKEGIYYLNIEDVTYKESNVLKQTTFSKQFNIAKIEPIISISPAMVKTGLERAKTSFKIQLKNKGNQEAEFAIASLKPFASPSVSSLTIPAETTKEFYIYLYSSQIEKEDSTSIILTNIGNNYSIPVWVSKEVYYQGEKNITNETITVPEQTTEEPVIPITFFIEINNTPIIIDNLTREIPNDQTLRGILKFKNNLNRTINNLNFGLTGNLYNLVRMNISFLGSIAPYEIKEQYLWVNEEKNPLLDYYSGELTLDAEGISQITFPLEFSINRTVELEEEPTLFKEEVITESKEQEETPIEEVYLNLSKKPKTYTEEEEKPNTNIIMYVIIAIIFLIIFLFLKRKKQPLKQTFNEYISEIEKKK